MESLRKGDKVTSSMFKGLVATVRRQTVIGHVEVELTNNGYKKVTLVPKEMLRKVN